MCGFADVALDKLDEFEKQIMLLADNPYTGTNPRYMILRRQGYKVLITDKKRRHSPLCLRFLFCTLEKIFCVNSAAI